LQALEQRREEIHLAALKKLVQMFLWKLPPQKLQLPGIRSLQVAIAEMDLQHSNPFLNKRLLIRIASSRKPKMLHAFAMPGSARCQIRCNPQERGHSWRGPPKVLESPGEATPGKKIEEEAEWPSFDQKRLLWSRPDVPVSALTKSSLPQPKRAASLTPLTRIDNFVELKTCF
jgi:hypothetical protein